MQQLTIKIRPARLIDPMGDPAGNRVVDVTFKQPGQIDISVPCDDMDQAIQTVMDFFQGSFDD